MKLFIPFVVLVNLGLSSLCFSAGYKVKKVIYVGSCDSEPLLAPLKWSPDGSKLAYFTNNKLMISDSLGNNYEIKKLIMSPNRYEWINNNKLIIHKKIYNEDGNDVNKLVTLDINNGEEVLLEEFARQRGSNSKVDRYFDGPRLTIEGNIYYTIIDNNIENIQIIGGKSFGDNKALGVDKNNLLRWGEDVLYIIKANRKDSIKYNIKKPYQYMPYPTIISPDKSHILYGGLIINLLDSSTINLDTLIKEFPPKTEGCGFSYYHTSFNPTETEILYLLSCDDGHSYEVNRIGTFNYTTGEFIILDTLIGISNCSTPVYNPDGNKITFIADGKIYIIYREEI